MNVIQPRTADAACAAYGKRFAPGDDGCVGLLRALDTFDPSFNAQTEAVEAADAIAAVALWHAPILKRDAITFSACATSLVRAGLATRAYVMTGWMNVRPARRAFEWARRST